MCLNNVNQDREQPKTTHNKEGKFEPLKETCSIYTRTPYVYILSIPVPICISSPICTHPLHLHLKLASLFLLSLVSEFVSTYTSFYSILPSTFFTRFFAKRFGLMQPSSVLQQHEKLSSTTISSCIRHIIISSDAVCLSQYSLHRL